MSQGDPKTFEPPATLPDSVVYDIFADTANRLDGKFIHLERLADNPEDKEQWRSRSFGLMREKRAVNADDRAALIEHVNRWLTELNKLRQS